MLGRFVGEGALIYPETVTPRRVTPLGVIRVFFTGGGAKLGGKVGKKGGILFKNTTWGHFYRRGSFLQIFRWKKRFLGGKRGQNLSDLGGKLRLFQKRSKVGGAKLGGKVGFLRRGQNGGGQKGGVNLTV